MPTTGYTAFRTEGAGKGSQDMSQEKIYKALGGAGAANIAVGIVVLLCGLVSGIMMIVTGAKLLVHRSNVII